MVNSLFEWNQSLNRMWLSITLSLSWLLEYPGWQIQEWHGEIFISHVMKSGMQLTICSYHAEALSSSIYFKMSGTLFNSESNWKLQLWLLGVITSLPWCRQWWREFLFFVNWRKRRWNTRISNVFASFINSFFLHYYFIFLCGILHQRE